MGEGSAHSVALVIGEAPGATEQVMGRPFVGKCGELLRSTLLDGIEHLVFITNVLACRPPQNRDPVPNEAVACLPHLFRLAEILKPRVIVAIGRIARDHILPGAYVPGKWDTMDALLPGLGEIIHPSLCFYLRHPSYLIRRGGLANRHSDEIIDTSLTQYEECRAQIERCASGRNL